jgi:hypothetical protein
MQAEHQDLATSSRLVQHGLSCDQPQHDAYSPSGGASTSGFQPTSSSNSSSRSTSATAATGQPPPTHKGLSTALADTPASGQQRQQQQQQYVASLSRLNAAVKSKDLSLLASVFDPAAALAGEQRALGHASGPTNCCISHPSSSSARNAAFLQQGICSS